MEHGETTAVDHFLTEFKMKLKIWNVIFWSDRQKNTQTIANQHAKPNHWKRNETSHLR